MSQRVEKPPAPHTLRRSAFSMIPTISIDVKSTKLDMASVHSSVSVTVPLTGLEPAREMPPTNAASCAQSLRAVAN
jgi:hypothetical protein